MKHIIGIFSVLCFLTTAAQKHTKASDKPYDVTARHNDSLLIYNTYASEIETLTHLRTTDLQSWYDREAADDKLTVCAKIRLKAYNHNKDYEPDNTIEREGFGTAKHYPEPTNVQKTARPLEGMFITEKNMYQVIMIDQQTHFLSDSVDHRKKIPYIQQYHFDHGRIKYVDTLNPVTFEIMRKGSE